MMREKVSYDATFKPPLRHKYFINHLYITEACNCTCPICYAGSGGNKKAFLDVDTAVGRVKLAKAHGASSVLLIGGEPTVHPHLIEMVAALRGEGMVVNIATNGLELGRDPQLARQLKQAGTNRFALQFDTLQKETLRKMRGHEQLELKLQAIRHIQEAEVDLGLICTVTPDNLSEIGSLLRWCITLPKLPSSIAFQGMASIGRHDGYEAKTYSREAIVAEILRSRFIPDIGPNKFWPIPFFTASGYFVHPDCAANLYIIRADDRTMLLDDVVDMPKIIERMRRSTVNYNSPLAILEALKIILPGIPMKNLPMLLSLLTGRSRRGKKSEFMMIGTGAFTNTEFVDVNRVNRCGASVLTDTGSVPLCLYFTKGCRNSC